MPTISTFFGIVIQMFWRDHGPPHFHAIYAEHRDELMEDWERCSRLEPPNPIPPLE